MIVIYAEKADVGNKIAAALGGFDLPGGTHITFKNLKVNEGAVKKFQSKQGYLDITYKGKPCKVTWGYGHMYGLCDTEEYDPAYKFWKARPEAFIPKEFKLHAIKSDLAAFDTKLAQQRKITHDLFISAEYIINATDDDREGELIFSYIYESIRCKTPFQRAHFSSQTEKGIQDAFDHLLPSSAIALSEKAGRARSIYDWLIGTNLTARMSLKHPGGGVLSVGRVQTPVLKMLVDKELAIRSFTSSLFWTMEATFETSAGETYRAKHQVKRFDKKADAQAVLDDLGTKDGVVTAILSERTKRQVPLLYSLSALQMDANEKYGFTTKEVLEIAQWLYENGYTTYPRTKSQYLNDDMRPTVLAVLEALEHMPKYAPYLNGKKKDPASAFFDSSKVESHFAIIPTNEPPKSLSNDQRKIYDLIAKSVIRMIYSAAILENTTVTTTVDSHEFTSKGATIIESGWTEVDAKIKAELHPYVEKGDTVSGAYDCKEGKTEPPKRYTDKTLIAAMKSAGRDVSDDELKKILADPKIEGIGTEATRAEVLETLIKRGYAERKGKQFCATNKGIEFIGLLPIGELMSAEFTARMEKELSAIAGGTGDYADFIEQVKAQTIKWCSDIAGTSGARASWATSSPGGPVSGSKTGMLCPLCGKTILNGEYKWRCENPSCPFSINKEICKKPISETNVKKLLRGESITVKGMTGKSGKKFDGVLKLSKGDVVFDFGAKYQCPVCGRDIVAQAWGWGCSGYKDGCKFSVNKEICKKPIDETIF